MLKYKFIKGVFKCENEQLEIFIFHSLLLGNMDISKGF